MLFRGDEDRAEPVKSQAGQETFSVTGQALQDLAELEKIHQTVETPVDGLVFHQHGAAVRELQGERTFLFAVVPDRGQLNLG